MSEIKKTTSSNKYEYYSILTVYNSMGNKLKYVERLKQFIFSHIHPKENAISMIRLLEKLVADKYSDEYIYTELRKEYNLIKNNSKQIRNDEGRAEYRCREIIELLPADFKPTSLLDIGCDTGIITTTLGNMLDIDKANIHGADIISTNKMPKLVDGFNYHKINGSNIPLDGNSIDLITVLMVLHHVDKKKIGRLLKSIRNVLKPNGILVIREHDCDTKAESLLPDLLDITHGIYSMVLSDPSEHDNFSAEYYAKYNNMSYWKYNISKRGFTILRQFLQVKIDKRISYNKKGNIINPFRQYFHVFKKDSHKSDNID